MDNAMQVSALQSSISVHKFAMLCCYYNYLISTTQRLQVAKHKTLRSCYLGVSYYHKVLVGGKCSSRALNTSLQQSRKFAAISSSSAISGAMGNSGISVELFVQRTLQVKQTHTLCSTCDLHKNTITLRNIIPLPQYVILNISISLHDSSDIFVNKPLQSCMYNNSQKIQKLQSFN